MATTMPEHRGANKRALEYDDGGDGVPESMEKDPKKPKLLPLSSSPPPLPPPLTPPSQNSLKVKDIRKRELLPEVVYELLWLIKKAEKPDLDYGHDAQQKKTTDEINKEIKILPTSNYQNEISNIENKNENFKESHGNVEIVDEKPDIKLSNTEELNQVLSFIEGSVQNLEDLNLPTNKTEMINVKLETTSTTKSTDINIENVQKEDQKKNKTNVKEDIFKTSTLAEHISNSNVGNNVSKIDNLIMFSKKEQLLNLLKNCCLNGTSKIPTSKPYPCNCNHCLYVSNLPKDQWAVYNLYTPINSSNLTYCNSNDKPISNNMYDSEISASDCLICAKNDCCCANNSNTEIKPKIFESSKNAWLNDLVSLIKNNDILKDLNSNTNDSTSLKRIKNDESGTELIKSHLSLCNICKKSKNPNSISVCKCNYTHHSKRKRFSDIPTIVNGHCHQNNKNKSF